MDSDKFPTDEIRRHADDSISSIHHILRSPRRRLTILVVSQLADHDNAGHLENDSPNSSKKNTVPVRIVAQYITAIEEDVPAENASGKAYRSVYNSLTQFHLDVLHKARIIHYDPDRKVIKPKENLPPVAAIATVPSCISTLLLDEITIEMGAGDHCDSRSSIGD